MEHNDIISREEMRERMLKIARGELKPSPGDPKVWYESKEAKERALKR